MHVFWGKTLHTNSWDPGVIRLITSKALKPIPCGNNICCDHQTIPFSRSTTTLLNRNWDARNWASSHVRVRSRRRSYTIIKINIVTVPTVAPVAILDIFTNVRYFDVCSNCRSVARWLRSKMNLTTTYKRFTCPWNQDQSVSLHQPRARAKETPLTRRCFPSQKPAVPNRADSHRVWSVVVVDLNPIPPSESRNVCRLLSYAMSESVGAEAHIVSDQRKSGSIDHTLPNLSGVFPICNCKID